MDEVLHVFNAWGAFALVGIVLLCFAIYFVWYYSDKNEREPFALIVTILSLAICLNTVALFPIDIFLVSNIMDPTTGLRNEWATDEAITKIQHSVKVVYYVAYSLITSFCFFWVPLSYFYFEEGEVAEEEQSVLGRLWTSLKYTVFFILVACILLLTGLITQLDRHDGIDIDWLRKLMVDLAKGTGPTAFVVGVLTLIGLGVLICYTAPGLSLLPLQLIAGSKPIPGRLDDTGALLAVNHERQNAILNRYQQFLHNPNAVMGPGGRGRNPVLSERDRQAMTELAQEEMMLTNRSRRVQRLRNSWFYRLQSIIRPFQVLLGLIGTGLTVLLVVSLAITSIGQTNNDICGAPCGYIFRGDLPNPLNMLFLKLSPYFPIDYVLIVTIILYMFWATTKGVISIGIRVLWVNLYEFRKGATQPQGLLAGTMILMLSLSGLCYSLTMSVAPEYSMFGSQKYCNHTIPATGTRDCSDQPSLIVPCHIGAPSDLCVATVTSTIILKIIAATPSLGIAFFYLQWGFIAVFILALLFNLARGCTVGFKADPMDEGDEDLEEIEARGLLSGELNTEDGRRRVRRRGLLAQGGGQENDPEYGRGHNYGAVGSSR